jgi:hypothetical protein
VGDIQQIIFHLKNKGIQPNARFIAWTFYAQCDKVYQLLAHGRWFSAGTPASSTTKIGRHDIAEVLLKVALNTKNIQEMRRSCVLDGLSVQLNVCRSCLLNDLSVQIFVYRSCFRRFISPVCVHYTTL